MLPWIISLLVAIAMYSAGVFIVNSLFISSGLNNHFTDFHYAGPISKLVTICLIISFCILFTPLLNDISATKFLTLYSLQAFVSMLSTIYYKSHKGTTNKILYIVTVVLGIAFMCLVLACLWLIGLGEHV